MIAVLLSALLTLLLIPKQATPNINNQIERTSSVTKVAAKAKPQDVPSIGVKKTLATTDDGTTGKKKPPAPVPIPKPQAALTGCESYRPLFDKYDWNVNVAMAIMQAESGCNSSSISPVNYDGVRDYGLMQLHGMDILNPAQNIEAAYYHKYLTQGWEAWSTYNSGKYLSYLE